MNLLQLSYFRVVARIGHMTKAAEELSIAQPSLSKTIHRLEKEIGVPLFDRQGRSIQLNRFGKVFLGHIDTIFYELDEGQRKVRDMAGLEHGEVSLVSSSIYWLPEVLHRFQVLHPTVRFQLSQCPLSEMPQRLESGTCDFCFLSTPLIKPGIQWRSLLREEIILVIPPEHRLAGQETIPLREVAQDAVVIEKVGCGLRDQVDQYCQQAGFIPHIAYEIDEPAALYEFVKAQLGVAFVPALMKKQIDEQGLLSLRLTDPICLRTFGIAWYQEHYLSEAARTFHQFVTEHFVALEQEMRPQSSFPLF
jgi:DNA-binding transcriptional LysR family regulator